MALDHAPVQTISILITYWEYVLMHCLFKPINFPQLLGIRANACNFQQFILSSCLLTAVGNTCRSMQFSTIHFIEVFAHSCWKYVPTHAISTIHFIEVFAHSCWKYVPKHTIFNNSFYRGVCPQLLEIRAEAYNFQQFILSRCLPTAVGNTCLRMPPTLTPNTLP